MTTQTKQDAAYLELMLSPMRRCASYVPAFGKGADEKVTLAQFKVMYSEERPAQDRSSRARSVLRRGDDSAAAIFESWIPDDTATQPSR